MFAAEPLGQTNQDYQFQEEDADDPDPGQMLKYRHVNKYGPDCDRVEPVLLPTVQFPLQSQFKSGRAFVDG